MIREAKMNRKHQVMPPLKMQEYKDLEADILKRGVQVPIEIDEDGNVLDGFHRLEICQKHGLSYPTIIREGLTEKEKIEHATSLNSNRRHLPQGERRKFVLQLRQEGKSIRQIAERARVSVGTVHGDLSTVQNRTVGLPDRIVGKDGRSRPAHKPNYNDKVRKEPVLLDQFDVDIRQGDFREVLSDIEPKSVKVILTDPPYGKKYLPLWEDLGKFASRVLRPDGVLIAYSGQFYLPQVMTMLGEYLQWWWLCGVKHKGSGNLTPLGQPVRKVINQFKPLLVYIPKDGTGVDVVFRDLVDGTGAEKAKHNWQQPISEAKEVLERFCPDGGLVVDPFAGSGAFGVAARELGFPFIGAEILGGSNGKVQ